MEQPPTPSAVNIPKPAKPYEPEEVLNTMADKDVSQQISELEDLHRELTAMLSRAQA
ncbi:hypothetical protein JTE88_04835 [Arcanobacterium phocisimile]|uniref:Uncharacterized protein n=1 Tax=Arcanobacterium phocisimile TaxID=1302235 RepID=A0ABX7IEL5_9ACTO|nr:hypothetical protein [Arcanobacterium phocisimile]QRV01447.1 hypothetical protein JTE88_04835 [Arcanobacterium phocisimile]